MSNWRRSLRRLGTLAAADEVDRALRRSCIGRIVSLLTLIFIVLCIGLWVLLFASLQASGLGQRLPESVTGPVLAVAFCGGLLFCIVLAGLIGEWLRRRIWRLLVGRRRNRYGL